MRAHELDPIDATIAIANFDEHDLDIGESGACGVFAMALCKVLAKHGFMVTPALVCVTDKRGQPRIGANGPIWKHAVVKANGNLYDITGRVQLADLIENFCWQCDNTPKGALLDLDYAQFLTVIRKTRNAFYRSYLIDWARRLDRAATSLQ